MRRVCQFCRALHVMNPKNCDRCGFWRVQPFFTTFISGKLRAFSLRFRFRSVRALISGTFPEGPTLLSLLSLRSFREFPLHCSHASPPKPVRHGHGVDASRRSRVSILPMGDTRHLLQSGSRYGESKGPGPH